MTRMTLSTTVAALLFGFSTITATAVEPVADEPMVFSASGANATDIQMTVDDFRHALGELNPNVVGTFFDGRREINWDGVPDDLASPNAFPPNFFNDPVDGSPRGLVLFTPGSSFQVSATAASGVEVEFGNLAANFKRQFATFSPERLFTALDDTIVEVLFFVSGTPEGATTTGFGAVFTDVDRKESTKIDYFDVDGNLLKSVAVPPGPVNRESLSFVGVVFDAPKVFMVRITSGELPLPQTNGRDGVVMDDFIYGEPQPTFFIAD